MRIEGHVPTAEQHRLLIERVRPVFKAMAAVGLRDPFALGPRWAPAWKRFFELVGNWHYVTRRQPPGRRGDDHHISDFSDDFPDRERGWRICAGLAAGPPPRPRKRLRRLCCKPEAPGSGLLKFVWAGRILKSKATKRPAKFFATAARAPRTEGFRASRAFKIRLKFRRGGRS
jgi:hypothetical protein